MLAVICLLFSQALHAAPGDLDMGFNPNVAGSLLWAVAIQPDGKIVIGGDFGSVGGVVRTNAARLQPDGTPDTGFTASIFPNTVHSIAIQPDGKIILTGDNGIGITRLNYDGTVDGSFHASLFGQVQGTALQADGRIIIFGGFSFTSGVNSGVTKVIARLNADGTEDTVFDPGVFVSGGTPIISSAAFQTDGKVVISGSFSSINGIPRKFIARLSSDGTLESNWAPSRDTMVFSTSIQADGKLVIGGDFFKLGVASGYNPVAQLFPEGSSNPSYLPNANNSVFSTTAQVDGKIIIGGLFNTVKGVTRNAIARLNVDGSLDMGFNANVTSSYSPSYYYTSSAVQGDGKIVIAGNFTAVNGVTRNLVARLDNDPALQSLNVLDTNSVQWLREGASAEAQYVTFDFSNIGNIDWIPIGVGTRIAGGWELNGLSLPAVGHIRARARIPSGFGSRSSGLVEAVTTYNFLPPIQRWKITHLGNPDADDLADPDHDGLLTLAEYGLNLLPETPSQPPTVAVFSYAEGQRLQMYVSRDPTHSDVTVTIEASDNLAGPWMTLATSTLGAPFTGPGYVGGDDATPGVKNVEIRDIVNIFGTNQRWMRSKVSY